MDKIKSIMLGSRLARERDQQPLDQIVTRIDTLLAEEPDDLRRAEASGLVDILCERRDADAIPHLVRFASRERYPSSLRPKILNALGVMNAVEQSHFISEFANAAHPREIREAAVNALARLSAAEPATSIVVTLLNQRKAPHNWSEIFWLFAERNEAEAKKFFSTLTPEKAKTLLTLMPRESPTLSFVEDVYGEMVTFTGNQLSLLTAAQVVRLIVGRENAPLKTEILDSVRVVELQEKNKQKLTDDALKKLELILKPSCPLWDLGFEQLIWARKNAELVKATIAGLPMQTQPREVARRFAVLAHLGDGSGLGGLYEMAASASEETRGAAAWAFGELTESLTGAPKSALPPPTAEQAKLLQRLLSEQSTKLGVDPFLVCHVLGVEMPLSTLTTLMTDPSVQRRFGLCELVAKRDLEGQYIEAIYRMLTPDDSRRFVLGALWSYLGSPNASVREKAVTYLEEHFARDAASDAVMEKRKEPDRYSPYVVGVFEQVVAAEGIPLLEDIVRNATHPQAIASGLFALARIAPERAFVLSLNREMTCLSDSAIPKLYRFDHSGAFTDRVLGGFSEEGFPKEELVEFLLRQGRAEHRNKLMEIVRGEHVPRRIKMIAAWAVKGITAHAALTAFGFSDADRLLTAAREHPYHQDIEALHFLRALEAAKVLAAVDTSRTGDIPPANDELLQDLFRCARGIIAPDRIQQVFSAEMFEEPVWSLEVLVREKLYALHFHAFGSYYEVSNSVKLVELVLQDEGASERFTALHGGEAYLFGSRDFVERMALEFFVPVNDERLNQLQDLEFVRLFRS